MQWIYIFGDVLEKENLVLQLKRYSTIKFKFKALYFNYHIYLATRQGFASLERVQIIKSVLYNFAVI